jgi:hypothetical protein
MADPFIDDPMPPMPTPSPATDVYNVPARKSPYKVSTIQEVHRQRAIAAAASRFTPPAPRSEKVALPSAAAQVASQQSVLRRTTAVRPAPAQPSVKSEASPSEPARLPVTIRRTSAEIEVEAVDVPINPLRR